MGACAQGICGKSCLDQADAHYYNNGSVYAGAATSKTFPTNQIAYGATTSLTHWSAAVAEGDYYVAVGCWGDPNRGGDTSAVWVD